MRLPALEKNILIYRALQMVLFLFYAESLRNEIVSSVSDSVNKNSSEKLKGAKLVKEIFRHLEKEKSLTSEESKEIQGLLDHRNKIAHDIQHLTGDIELPGKNYRFRDHLKLHYDYQALKKIKKWHDLISKRLSKNYWLSVGLNSLLFEAAEQAYERELSALESRIERQLLIRTKKIRGTS